jgi:hypothetical protein
MDLYLRYEYMCAVGEKGMFAFHISKTDQRFFPFQHRGSEEGYEHGMKEVTELRGGQWVFSKALSHVYRH